MATRKQEIELDFKNALLSLGSISYETQRKLMDLLQEAFYLEVTE